LWDCLPTSEIDRQKSGVPFFPNTLWRGQGLIDVKRLLEVDRCKPRCHKISPS
jgi:hypothetical protein